MQLDGDGALGGGIPGQDRGLVGDKLVASNGDAEGILSSSGHHGREGTEGNDNGSAHCDCI